MAKKKKGVPEGFDIDIATGTLAEPANVPGYLDEVEEQEERLATKEITPPPPASPRAPARTQTATSKLPVVPKPNEKRTKKQTARSSFSRLDAGLSEEEDAQLRAVLEIISKQCRKRITRSELGRALLAAAYEARNNYAGGFTAHRTRWGARLNKELEADLRDAIMAAIGQRERERNEE